jgi:hypothetical protein
MTYIDALLPIDHLDCDTLRIELKNKFLDQEVDSSFHHQCE